MVAVWGWVRCLPNQIPVHSGLTYDARERLLPLGQLGGWVLVYGHPDARPRRLGEALA